ncbi:MAG: hypothetical protein AAF580_00130 [Pseudomonadota bacterium]
MNSGFSRQSSGSQQIEVGTLACGNFDGACHDVAALRRKLRRERARGKAGHWAYDLARHLKLARQLKTIQARQARAPKV